MRILEPGRVGEKWTLQHRCTGWGNSEKGCQALLEVELDDLRYRTSLMNFNSGESSVSFKCPCCGQLTDLGRNDWPSGYSNLEKWSREWQDSLPETSTERKPDV